MYATHPLMVIDAFAKIGKLMSNKKNYEPDTKTCQNPYKFDFEVQLRYAYLLQHKL